MGRAWVLGLGRSCGWRGVGGVGEGDDGEGGVGEGGGGGVRVRFCFFIYCNDSFLGGVWWRDWC